MWLLTLIAILLLNDLSFKIFDLSLMIITVFSFFGDSLNAATNSNRNLKKIGVNFRENAKYLITLIFINIFIEIFLILTNLDIKILEVFFGNIPLESLFFFRLVLLIPIPLIIFSYFHGRAQNLGNYSYCAISRIFGLTFSLILYFPAFIFELPNLLIIGLILEKFISSLVLYILEIYK